MTLHSQKGGALLAVLWLSAALAAIGFSVSTMVRSETDRVSTSADGLRAWYLATGSVERAVQWAIWGPAFRNPDGSVRFWEFNQPRLHMTYPSGDVVVEMIPESGKFNINTATGEELGRLVLAVTGDPARTREIVEGILDWRTPSGSPSMFDPNSSTRTPTFRVRHASFEEIEELLLVRGVTPELFYGNYITDPNGRQYASGGLRDCLTVWKGSPGFYDINTASPAVMEALGVPPNGVAAIVDRRRQQPFGKPSELAAFDLGGSRLSVGGGLFWTIRATARLRRPDGAPSEVVRTAGAVIKLLDRAAFAQMPVHILRWYDDAWSQSAIAPPGAQSGAPTP